MSQISNRFRGFLPVVIDVETGGFDCDSHALLEIAAIPITMDTSGKLKLTETIACHVEPFEGAQLDPKALEFTGIDPYHPFRLAKPEAEALEMIFDAVAEQVRLQQCTRAILVGHNPFFDLGFIKAAAKRQGFKKMPFHQFSTFDTATLGGLAFGQTVLARAAKAAGIKWDNQEAHSAVYDAERTAELFCDIVNRWDESVKLPESG
ncbi:MAG: ribonuclease T [Thiohalophilus sp.]|jgi:ribonuclease T